MKNSGGYCITESAAISLLEEVQSISGAIRAAVKEAEENLPFLWEEFTKLRSRGISSEDALHFVMQAYWSSEKDNKEK